MRWTIGMPSYNNMTEVYFTVQAFRMYHDLRDCEIVIVDNYGDDALADFVKKSGGGQVRYERFTDITGVSAPKNRIFEIARGEYVLCIDSHILVKPGFLALDLPGDDLVQGPLVQANAKNYWCEWLPVWRARMWGIWGSTVQTLPKMPYEIWAMGAGFFATRRSSWLGFNKNFKGFGGETGYLQEKYRKAGRKVWCDPRFVWMHMFYNQGRKIPYPLDMNDRIRNYVLGFDELGLDKKPMYDHFGTDLVKRIENEIKIKISA